MVTFLQCLEINNVEFFQITKLDKNIHSHTLSRKNDMSSSHNQGAGSLIHSAKEKLVQWEISTTDLADLLFQRVKFPFQMNNATPVLQT